MAIKMNQCYFRIKPGDRRRINERKTMGISEDFLLKMPSAMILLIEIAIYYVKIKHIDNIVL